MPRPKRQYGAIRSSRVRHGDQLGIQQRERVRLRTKLEIRHALSVCHFDQSYFLDLDGTSVALQRPDAFRALKIAQRHSPGGFQFGQLGINSIA